jgi:hypothetical protein
MPPPARQPLAYGGLRAKVRVMKGTDVRAIYIYIYTFYLHYVETLTSLLVHIGTHMPMIANSCVAGSGEAPTYTCITWVA